MSPQKALFYVILVAGLAVTSFVYLISLDKMKNGNKNDLIITEQRTQQMKELTEKELAEKARLQAQLEEERKQKLINQKAEEKVQQIIADTKDRQITQDEAATLLNPVGAIREEMDGNKNRPTTTKGNLFFSGRSQDPAKLLNK